VLTLTTAGPSGFVRGVQLVLEVPQGIGLAVSLRGERGAHRGAQVGGLKSRALKVGREPDNLRGERGRVGERVVQFLPHAHERRQGRSASGDDMARVRVPGADHVKVGIGAGAGIWH
jgi:hypothetical protein